jgi:hypothetical protein
MNVVLNADESHVVLTLVSSLLLDNVELSEESRQKIRDWRRERDPGNRELDEFTVFLNERLGNFIDERTTRMMRVRGKRKVSETERWR